MSDHSSVLLVTRRRVFLKFCTTLLEPHCIMSKHGFVSFRLLSSTTINSFVYRNVQCSALSVILYIHEVFLAVIVLSVM